MTRLCYPVFLDLQGRRCVVIGGGAIAQRKVAGLLRFGAEVTLISPSVTKPLGSLAARGRVRHLARTFRAGDLAGAWLVYAATDDASVNERVWREAALRRIFVNAVDQPARCSFIAPSIARRGELIVAVSTGGASPTVAKRLRRQLQATIGPEYGPLLRFLRGLRAVAKQRLPRYQDRQRYFEALLDGPAPTLVHAKQPAKARRAALTLLAEHAKARG